MTRKMFGVPDPDLPIVYRLGGSKIFHATTACTRLNRPQKNGDKIKTPSSFDLEQARALAWKPCAACAAEYA